MTATVLRRPAPQRSFGDRASILITNFLTWVGDVYDRKDAAKRSGLSWHYFAA